MALIVSALAVPLIIGILGVFDGQRHYKLDGSVVLTDVNMRDKLIQSLDETLASGISKTRTSVCFAVELDEFRSIEERYGRKAGDEVLAKTAERIVDSLRDYDVIARVDPATFAVPMA
ncbi:MAG: diguanylate cyclase, partial [Pseudomonadota bacterium]